MSSKYDAIIVGAGIIGCGIAYALAAGGRKVLAVDRNPAAGYGSTSNSTAIVRTFYSTREGCALAWEGLHIWRDWAAYLGLGADAPLSRFTGCGAVVLRNGQADGMDAICAHLSALGIPWESWELATVSKRIPAIDVRSFHPPRRIDDDRFGEANGSLTGALHFPDSGYVGDPQLAAGNLRQAAEARGAIFRFGATVTEFSVESGRVAGVVLDDGAYVTAPIVVNAGGPYSANINRMAGVLDGMSIGCRPLRQEVCLLQRPSGLGAEKQSLIVLDSDLGTYFRTERDDALLAGGMEAASDPLVWVDDPDSFDRNPTDQWTHQAYRMGLRLPEMGIPGQARGVVDLYDVSDDWIPIYDKSDLPGFYMAVGTSGNQFKNGPVAGRLMAGLIDYCEAGGDHDGEPYRFPLTYTAGAIDTSIFSRRRKVSAESSMNVIG